MTKVFVVGGSTGYARWIDNLQLVDNINEADIVLFTGGEDINPALYHCKKHSTTHFNKHRDAREVEAWNKVKKNQLVVGICRGLQLICALSGGKLVQDCSNHWGYGTHGIVDNRDNPTVGYEIMSIHHQMVYPYDLPKEDYDILYVAEGEQSSVGIHNMSEFYEGDQINPALIRKNGEPEVVVFHQKNKPVCLGIQGHPEMMPSDSPVLTMLNNLIEKLQDENK